MYKYIQIYINANKYINMYKYNIYFTFKYPLKLYIVLIYIFMYIVNTCRIYY